MKIFFNTFRGDRSLKRQLLVLHTYRQKGKKHSWFPRAKHCCGIARLFLLVYHNIEDMLKEQSYYLRTSWISIFLKFLSFLVMFLFKIKLPDRVPLIRLSKICCRSLVWITDSMLSYQCSNHKFSLSEQSLSL